MRKSEKQIDRKRVTCEKEMQRRNSEQIERRTSGYRKVEIWFIYLIQNANRFIEVLNRFILIFNTLIIFITLIIGFQKIRG